MLQDCAAAPRALHESLGLSRSVEQELLGAFWNRWRLTAPSMRSFSCLSSFLVCAQDCSTMLMLPSIFQELHPCLLPILFLVFPKTFILIALPHQTAPTSVSSTIFRLILVLFLGSRAWRSWIFVASLPVSMAPVCWCCRNRVPASRIWSRWTSSENRRPLHLRDAVTPKHRLSHRCKASPSSFVQLQLSHIGLNLDHARQKLSASGQEEGIVREDQVRDQEPISCIVSYGLDLVGQLLLLALQAQRPQQILA